MTTLKNISSTKSVFYAVFSGYDGPNPPPVFELKPGKKVSYEVDDITCWYVYSTSAAPDTTSHNSSEDSTASQMPFWTGQLYKNDVATINPDNGVATVNSRIVQSNTDGILAAQIMGNFSFSYFIGNKAVIGNGVPMHVEHGTPYLVFRIFPVPNSSFNDLDLTLTVSGPDNTIINQPVKNDHVTAIANTAGNLISVIITLPAKGIWTARVSTHSPSNGDYVLMGSVGAASAEHASGHDAIKNATTICRDVLGSLLQDENGNMLKESVNTTAPPGACFVCLVEWYVVGSLLIGMAPGAFALLEASNVVVKIAVDLFGVSSTSALSAFHTLANSKYVDPLSWPRAWCTAISMCNKEE